MTKEVQCPGDIFEKIIPWTEAELWDFKEPQLERTKDEEEARLRQYPNPETRERLRALSLYFYRQAGLESKLVSAYGANHQEFKDNLLRHVEKCITCMTKYISLLGRLVEEQVNVSEFCSQYPEFKDPDVPEKGFNLGEFV